MFLWYLGHIALAIMLSLGITLGFTWSLKDY